MNINFGSDVQVLKIGACERISNSARVYVHLDLMYLGNAIIHLPRAASELIEATGLRTTEYRSISKSDGHSQAILPQTHTMLKFMRRPPPLKRPYSGLQDACMQC